MVCRDTAAELRVASNEDSQPCDQVYITEDQNRLFHGVLEASTRTPRNDTLADESEDTSVDRIDIFFASDIRSSDIVDGDVVENE